MISLIEFRKDRLTNFRKVFKDDNDVRNHISKIKKEILITNKDQRMLELKNWVNIISK